ncbi:general transcription factor 3C polypeptide 6 [Ceratina calcarata]|uniref:General transcription factor 3C polypeptide 6 n=1 Tax=Ceratina calcarata TaxID=156304 RepID=A0AAJ7J921_9HYME|nr:general transcription factor 3C polypeptide 6 [Ceratina calcarata]
MGIDDEVSEDEEEILVYVEFEELTDSNVLSDKNLQLDMIGIDTEHPIMQINGKFYEGTYEDDCGTYMFFTKDDNPTVNDPVFDVAPNLKYFAKTRKSLKMRRVFIKPRTEVLGDSEHNECIPNLDTLKQAGIPFQYQAEALSFWKTMRDNRLKALESYLEKQRIREQKRSEGITLESESDEDNPFAVYKHKESMDTDLLEKEGQN